MTMEPTRKQIAELSILAMEKLRHHPFAAPLTAYGPESFLQSFVDEAIRLAYAAGADAELEACCELADSYWESGTGLRDARRPKPPNWKLAAQNLMASHEDGWIPTPSQWEIIRRAIDLLPDD